MHDERGTMNGQRTSIGRRAILLAVFCSSFIVHTSSLLATPTQEEVFKSINENVGQSTEPGKFMALIFGAAGVVILLVLFSQRRKRDVAPRSLNHQGKLLKE